MRHAAYVTGPHHRAPVPSPRTRIKGSRGLFPQRREGSKEDCLGAREAMTREHQAFLTLSAHSTRSHGKGGGWVPSHLNIPVIWRCNGSGGKASISPRQWDSAFQWGFLENITFGLQFHFLLLCPYIMVVFSHHFCHSLKWTKYLATQLCFNK